MANVTPKGYVPLGEAVARIGRRLDTGWTGEEFSTALASKAKIEQDAKTYLVGWIKDLIPSPATAPSGKRVSRSKAQRMSLGVLEADAWDHAEEIYDQVRSYILEIEQHEQIQRDSGHLAKIAAERPVTWNWPKDFPLTRNDLNTLRREARQYCEPRQAAWQRLQRAAEALQQDLCGTPPNCEDATPTLWCDPEKMPVKIEPASWVGDAGVDRIKALARADQKDPGSSRVIVSMTIFDRRAQKHAGRPAKYDWVAFHSEIARIVGTDPDGFPTLKADLERTMASWCLKNWGENHCPVESMIRKQISRYYRKGQ